MKGSEPTASSVAVGRPRSLTVSRETLRRAEAVIARRGRGKELDGSEAGRYVDGAIRSPTQPAVEARRATGEPAAVHSELRGRLPKRSTIDAIRRPTIATIKPSSYVVTAIRVAHQRRRRMAMARTSLPMILGASVTSSLPGLTPALDGMRHGTSDRHATTAHARPGGWRTTIASEPAGRTAQPGDLSPTPPFPLSTS